MQVPADSPVARPRSTLVRVASILSTTLAGAAWLAYKGPVPVIRITAPLPEMAPFWYMLLAFPVLGMLVADLFELWRVVAWFLFRRLRLRNVPPRQSRLEVWIAAGVLAAVAWPKLFWWDDPVTLLAGIGAAALLAPISGWAGGHVPPIDPDKPAGMPALPGTARLFPVLRLGTGVALLALS